MYTVTKPRTPQDALAALLLPDADYTLPRLLDAMLALPQFGDPDTTPIDPQRAVLGNLDLWTYAAARKVIDHAFGTDGHDNLKHAVAYCRDNAVSEMDQVFFLRIGLLLRGGWTQADGWLWWTTWPVRVDGMPLDLAAGWVGAWGLDSLNACVSAGLSAEELRAILDSGTLPEPEAIEMLSGLRRRP